MQVSARRNASWSWASPGALVGGGEGWASQAWGHKVQMLGLGFLNIPPDCTCTAAGCSLSDSTPQRAWAQSQFRRIWEGPEGSRWPFPQCSTFPSMPLTAVTDFGKRLHMWSGAQPYIPDSPGPLMVLPFHSSSLAFIKPHVSRQIPRGEKGLAKPNRVQSSGQEASRCLDQLVLLNRGL